MREVLRIRRVDDRDVDRAAAVRPTALVVVAEAADQDGPADGEQNCARGKPPQRALVDARTDFGEILVRVLRRRGG